MKINGDELVIPLTDLITEATIPALCKTAVFSETLAEFVCKILVDGQCHWDEDEARGEYNPWSLYRTGAPQAFEKARQEVAKLVDPITQKLVSDLTKQRDGLIAECEKLHNDNFEYRSANESLRNELRRLVGEEPASRYEVKQEAG